MAVQERLKNRGRRPDLQVGKQGRPFAFWFIVVFLTASIVLMLIGQTVSVFDYDLTVRLGLQEKPDEVGPFGVQTNRAFGVGDTIVYIPLMIASVVGLGLRKRWALLVTAAVAAVSAYWSVTIAAMFLFLPSAPEYTLWPGPELWLFVVSYIIFGVWGLGYVIFRGENLLK